MARSENTIISEGAGRDLRNKTQSEVRNLLQVKMAGARSEKTSFSEGAGQSFINKTFHK